MPGFSNGIMFADNVDFTGNGDLANNQITANGQLLIGSSSGPKIRTGTITSTGGTITVTNGPGTINIEADESVPTTFDGNTGSATPISNILNIKGITAQGISTSAGAPSGNDVQITAFNSTTTQKGVIRTSTDAESIAGTATDKSVTPESLKAKLGVQTTNTIPYGAGDSSAISWTSAATDGQLVIGATGAAPAFASLTSTGGTITITPGANTLNIDAHSSVATQYDGDTGSATPASNILTLAGDATQGLVTSASGSTVTFTNSDATTSQKGVLETSTDAESVSGTATDKAVTPESLKAKLGPQTAYAVICGGTTAQTTALQSIASVGTANQVLTSNGAGALPTFQDAGASTTLQFVTTSTTAAFNNSTPMPIDDTIPQNTEGDEVLTLAITPISATSTLVIQFSTLGKTDPTDFSGVALFVDATAGALAATLGPRFGTESSLLHTLTSGSTSARTYKIRAGPQSSGSLYLNSVGAGARLFGGVAATTLSIWEVE